MSKVKILLYCTKGKPYLYKTNFVKIEDVKKGILDKLVYEIDTNERLYLDGSKRKNLNGKIVCECECDKVEEIVYNGWWNCYADNDSIESNYFDNDLACLSVEKLKNYLGDKNGYALHLSNVKVFDRPKELRNYCKRLPNGDFQVLGNAPQNMMNVCEIKYLIEDYVLISIQPQHLVYILNGKKTIEVRRKIISPLKNLMGD